MVFLENNSIKVVDSKITKVTVFNDRAQVTRSSSILLVKGEHILVFDFLPDSIDEKSIQVISTKGVILKDVRFNKIFYDDIPDKDLKIKKSELEELKDNKRILDDTIKQANSEKDFIIKISNKLTTATEKSSEASLDTEQWIKMVNFYRTKLNSIDEEIWKAEKSLRVLNDKITKIINELKAISKGRNKAKNQVEIVVEVDLEEEIGVELIYIVFGTSWEPFYDIRVYSDKKIMNITYNAFVKQNTSENWDNVTVKLSTAQLDISGQQPELNPWYVDLNEQLMLRSANNGGIDIDDEIAPAARIYNRKSIGKAEELMSVMDIGIEPATVENKSTSVIFNIPGNNSINSDNQQHKLTILINDFPVEYSYSTVPKLSLYAYLKGKAKNTSDFPLLPGPTNIYVDNSYISSSTMELVAPDEEFWTSLGIDETMKVEYKFVKRFHSMDGVFNKQNRYTYEYIIIVTNNKKTDEDIVIHDQLPISTNEKIKITLISPAYKENDKNLKKDEHSFLKWAYRIKSGEKIEIPFKFIVEYPHDKTIRGL